MSITGIPELKQSYQQLGPVRFALIMLGVLTWIGIGAWLAMTAPGWPHAYGSTCRRKCFFDDLWYSPGLLSGGWHELALFAFLWSMPALIVAAALYALVKRLRRRDPLSTHILSE